MSDCVPFRLFVGDRVESVVSIMIGEMQRRGFQVSGALDSGWFSVPLPTGSISGTYAIAGKSLAISVTQRPEAISCGSIESKMQDLILDAKAELRSWSKLRA